MSRSGGSPLRALAFYLPQFHPIPENDEWWEPGFTEWTNVRRASRRFRGHYQPHVPLGAHYYDLRDPQVQVDQAALARENGVSGFVYYEYWFNGRRVLETPLEAMLANPDVDLPFCLCWANEDWTRAWDGRAGEVLLGQDYSDRDDLEHIRAVLTIMGDPRYIRVEGKPLYLVYNAAALPSERSFTTTWREQASLAGEPGLYLCRVESGGAGEKDIESGGWDAAVEFQPFTAALGKKAMWWRLGHRLTGGRGYFSRQVWEYGDLVRTMQKREPVAYKRFPGVVPSWDNSARRKRGAFILKGATPSLFGEWVRAVRDRFEPYSAEENFLFVNAWNEWAEGNHLEPDERWGHQWLQALAANLRPDGDT